MKQGLFPSFLFLWLVITGCSSSLKDIPTPTGVPINPANLILATETTSVEAHSSDVGVRDSCQLPDQPAGYTKPSYQLDVEVDMNTHLIHVLESVSYPNTSTKMLKSIRFVVDPNWHDGYFHLDKLSIQADEKPSFTLSEGFLDVMLDRPLYPGCSLVFNLEYTLTLPNQTGIYGYTDHQTVLTNWFPFIPPYQDESGWQTHQPGNYGEYLVYPIADYDVSLTLLPESHQLIVAAPATVSESENVNNYRLENARTFSFAILEGYKTLEKEVDGIHLNVHYRVANPRAAHSALKILSSAMTTFSELFGPYPFDTLTLAEIEMFDGMEYDGIFLLGEHVFATYKGTSRNLLTLLTAHETCHNWWFSQVGNNQAVEPWLDEALATYCELLFLETEYPGLVGWWWDFRVNTVKPSGIVNATIYTYPDYEQYRQAIYLRGVQFLHAVRTEMGIHSFNDFLQQYYSAGRDRVVSSEIFFEILENVYPDGVDELRAEYFGRQ